MTMPPQTPRRVLLLGGTSEIGLATVRALRLPDDAELILAGRSAPALQAAAADFGCRTSIELFDAHDLGGHAELISRVGRGGAVDLVLLAFGILGDQQRAVEDPAHAVEIVDVDFRAQVSLGLAAAGLLARQGRGTLVIFSSIAAVRARRANFVYGAAKAGLDAFASGLADHLAGTGAGVLIVRPGFVIGRMTAGMQPAPLATTPSAVGEAVARAIERGRSAVWVPPQLAGLAWVMRLTPRPLWRRMRR